MVHYVQAAAGGGHTVLLRSDGEVDAIGYNANGQCNVPSLPAGMHYTHVAAGDQFTVLLNNMGQPSMFGKCGNMQADFAGYAERAGIHYVKAAAGGDICVLICSDGGAIAF